MVRAMINEVISENVKMVYPKMGNLFSGGICPESIEIFDRGIFSIQLENVDDSLFRMNKIFDFYKSHGHLYKVGVYGTPTGESEETGSERFCNHSPELAEVLNSVIPNYLPFIDEHGNRIFPVSVSPYFRSMRYVTGGEHFPHYDSDFVYEGCGNVTKYSMVVYLTNNLSGEFAFVNDESGSKEDWTRQATNSEIYLKFRPKAGRILLFPHHLCHTVLPLTDVNKRVIIRGDIVF